MTLDIEQLKTFCDLCISKNFNKTAVNLGITESTVSYRIKEIEKYFGKKLFHRRADKTVDCTDFGEAFLPKAQEILITVSKYREKDQNGELIGTISISAGEIGGVYLLPPIIKPFEKKFSGIKLKVEINNSLETLQKLSESECDVGLTASTNFSPNPYSKSIEVIKLAKINFGVVVPLGHPLLKKDKASVTDLLGLPYVSRGENSGSHREILRILAEKGLKEEDLDVVWKFENSSSVINAVSEGLGISIIGKAQASKYVQGGLIGFIPLETNVESYLLLLDHWKGTNPVVNAFINFVKYYVATTHLSF